MKTLLVLRHAKAEADAPQGDADRALTGRGERDAASIGDKIKTLVGCPDLIVTSDARRARQTAKIVAKAVGYGPKVTREPAIYEADVRTLRDVVHDLPDSAGCVLIVGHNPGFEGLVAALTGGLHALPTAGLAHLEFDVDRWNNVAPGGGRLRGLYGP